MVGQLIALERHVGQYALMTSSPLGALHYTLLDRPRYRAVELWNVEL